MGEMEDQTETGNIIQLFVGGCIFQDKGREAIKALASSKRSIKPRNCKRTNGTMDINFTNGKHHSGPKGSGSGSNR
jgi:hypothetical protein